MIVVIGRVRCDPERRERLVALLERMQGDSRSHEIAATGGYPGSPPG
jgi:hypothetical protein